MLRRPSLKRSRNRSGNKQNRDGVGSDSEVKLFLLSARRGETTAEDRDLGEHEAGEELQRKLPGEE